MDQASEPQPGDVYTHAEHGEWTVVARVGNAVNSEVGLSGPGPYRSYMKLPLAELNRGHGWSKSETRSATSRNARRRKN